MKLPIYLFLSLALPLNGENLQEKITDQYYDSVKKQNYIIAHKVLESCNNDQQCHRLTVIQEALKRAKIEEDILSTAWISADLTLATQSFADRHPKLCNLLSVGIPLSLVGLGIILCKFGVSYQSRLE